jgi:TPR repeat protein
MRVFLLFFWFLATPLHAQTVDAASRAFFSGQYAEALAVLTPAAEAGNAQAQALLGMAYENGLGVPPDSAAAQKWYQRAAQAGDAPAQVALALLLLGQGGGTPDSTEQAVNWLAQAMAAGQADAFLLRARMLQQDLPALAETYFITALELGQPMAARELAPLYLAQGPEAQAKARQVLSRAASMGDAPAMLDLAQLYLTGVGGAADAAAGFTLLQEAVNLGYPPAAISLGEMMQSTPGYWADPVLAQAYCLWGQAQSGDDGTGAFGARCAALGAGLSAEQIAQAQAMANRF